MMTDTEKARVKQLRDAIQELAVSNEGELISEEDKARFVGVNMANVDGLFAIREGESWRGLTDPKEIAREILRQGEIGE